MKPATIPKPEPAECPQNPERRRFLRTALLTGAAFAAGCKSGDSDSITRMRIYKDVELPLGSSRIALVGCKDEGGTQEAYFRIYRGKGLLPDSVSMLVPGLFRIREVGAEHEVNVESVSCSGAQSAGLLIVTKSIPAENSQQSSNIPAGIPLAGAFFALLGAIIPWIKGRNPPYGQEDWRVLSPKRNNPRTE